MPCSTSANQAARGPSIVSLAQGAGGLPQSSLALCHQVTTLDKGKLVKRYGALNADELGAVNDGLKAALDLE